MFFRQRLDSLVTKPLSPNNYTVVVLTTKPQITDVREKKILFNTLIACLTIMVIVKKKIKKIVEYYVIWKEYIVAKNNDNDNIFIPI